MKKRGIEEERRYGVSAHASASGERAIGGEIEEERDRRERRAYIGRSGGDRRAGFHSRGLREQLRERKRGGTRGRERMNQTHSPLFSSSGWICGIRGLLRREFRRVACGGWEATRGSDLSHERCEPAPMEVFCMLATLPKMHFLFPFHSSPIELGSLGFLLRILLLYMGLVCSASFLILHFFGSSQFFKTCYIKDGGLMT